MTHAALLAALDTTASRGLPSRPSAWNEDVASGVEELTRESADARAAIRGALGGARSDALLGWCRAAATYAVRTASPRLVVLGFVGLSFHEGDDEREALRLVPLLQRAASVVGLGPEAAVDEAMALTDAEGRRWLAEIRDARHGVESMGFTEDVDDDGRFVFRDTTGGWDPEVVLADLLDEKRDP